MNLKVLLFCHVINQTLESCSPRVNLISVLLKDKTFLSFHFIILKQRLTQGHFLLQDKRDTML